MTRKVLMTVVLAAAPIVAAAQVMPAPPAPMPVQAPQPMPAPAAPLPPVAPAPLPAPMAVPAPAPFPAEPPTAPMAPVPPTPIDPFAYAFDFDLSSLANLDIQIPQIDLSHLADLDIQIPQLNDMAYRISEEIARVGPQVAQSAGQAVRQAEAQIEAARAQAEAARGQSDQARARAFEVQLRSGDAYNAGLGALQQREYDRAIQAFDRVIDARNARADAALYWKAFSEFKLARTDAALRTIGQLQKEHAQSRYLNDAKVLEAEARKQSGQRIDPAQLDDDEIKLLAIQGLQRTEQAVPLLEGVLNGANSLNVKKRAIYVLALSTEPRARDILLRYAKGGGNPDLQIEAVRLLVSRRDQQTTGTVLRELYDATPDTTVRRTIVDAYRTRSRDGAPDTSPLAGTAAQDLNALYQRETNADLRRHIVSVMVANGAIDQVVMVIRNERDAETRNRVIHALNVRNNPRATQALVDLYGSITETAAREAIINALAGQQNADALIRIAKAESNVQLKTRIVRHLSDMAPRSKAAADYLMEVIR